MIAQQHAGTEVAGENSHPSAGRAFDFLMGDWIVHHRRLANRLVGDTNWVDFDGTMSARQILGGGGNIDENIINLPDGSYQAISLRLFNPATLCWSIYWVDGRRTDALDPPVIGFFNNGQGRFLAHDTLDGRPIRVRFTWSDMSPTSGHWEQAFSPDDGASWEPNWTMTFTRP
ncbi:MAG: DUF1579 domain-containing protein [Tabrizicola sp.]|jgi:hypothetical protein|uniref:DUF1579 domain-containing protein n=1 Tax=Tabrizicola sp. TaxID=2005166 RepID=UPI003BAF6A62|nr:DUF1579 domain-containing protein [Tabrizicola sp.]